MLDNAESILDPQGTDAQEIYDVVEELSRFDNICICITSRISTAPPGCKRLDVPTLSRDAACDTFYRIYDSDVRSSLVDRILEQLEFHPLSITLLATVAHQNKWDMGRLAKEWDRRRTSVLHTHHNKSLAAAIEVSLASPMFQDLGPDARGLLEVVAFFPQGVDENNIDWLFPTVPDRTRIFDTFCVLSLTHRNGGFVTMLAPLRDYLSPKDPKLSSPLCAAKERYFIRMSANDSPDEPNFGESSRWITSEDVNVEHLLDVFTTVDANSDGVWDACNHFITRLIQHKPRPVILRQKIEGLPDDHRCKLLLLVQLLSLSRLIGNEVEHQQLLTHTLRLGQRLGDDHMVASLLVQLSGSNRLLGFRKEGIQQVKEGLEIFERLGNPRLQAQGLLHLAYLLKDDNQFDAAEEAVTRAVDLHPEQYLICRCHRLRGEIYRSKGETEKAIHHFELALGIASLLDAHDSLFWIHFCLAELFLNEGRFDDAQPHTEQAKLHVVNHPFNLGAAMLLQTILWYEQDKLEEARSEALRAADIFEELGAAKYLERCRELLRNAQNRLNDQATSGQPGFNREFLQWRCFLRVLTFHSKLRKPKLHRVLEVHPPTNSPPHPIFL